MDKLLQQIEDHKGQFIHKSTIREWLEEWNTRSQPEGMIILPREPTDKMIEAIRQVVRDYGWNRICLFSDDDFHLIYEVMIEAWEK